MRPRVALRYGRIAVLTLSVSLTVGAAVAADRLPERGRQVARADVAEQPENLPATGHEPRGFDISSDGEPPQRRSDTRYQRQADPAPPAESGQGRRVVFDLSAQRVWLVGSGDLVVASYLVSGSLSDNLKAGRYEVYSRSRHATSFDLDATMDYMVRFAHGQRVAIGFHDIPVDAQGRRLQRLSDLGTPQSHGCIRQRLADAQLMWEFASRGTPVVVTT